MVPQSPPALLACDLGPAPLVQTPRPGDVYRLQAPQLWTVRFAPSLQGAGLEHRVQSRGPDGFPTSPAGKPSCLPLRRPPRQSLKVPGSGFLFYSITHRPRGSTPPHFFPSSESLHGGHMSVPIWALLPGSWLDSKTHAQQRGRHAGSSSLWVGPNNTHLVQAVCCLLGYRSTGAVFIEVVRTIQCQLSMHALTSVQAYDRLVAHARTRMCAHAHTRTSSRSHGRKMYCPLPSHPKPEPKPQVPSSEHIPL